MFEKFMHVKPVIILVFIPILFTLVFGYVMSPIFVEHVPFAVYDMDKSENSRQVVDSFYDCPAFEITESIDSYDEIEDMLVGGKIGGALIIPAGFGDGLAKKSGAEATVLVDGSNFLVCSNVQLNSTTILLMANASIQMKYLESGGMKPTAAEQNVYTMNLADRRLYNPQTCYLYYLFAGLFGIFVQQTVLATVPGLLIDEKHRLRGICGAFKAVNENGAGGRQKWFGLGCISRETVGTLLKYAGLSIVGLLTSILIVHFVYAYPMNGNLLYVLLIHVIFLLGLLAVSLIVASVFEEKIHASQFTMFLSIPTMLCCGYGWPEYMMPAGFAPVMKAVWPLYYFYNPLKDLMLKCAGMDAIGHYVIGGIIFAAVWLVIGVFLYLRKTRDAIQSE